MYEVVIFEGAKECLSIDPENIEFICRCCLREKAETNIFETEYHGILFIKILTTLFAINDMEADDLPKNICENCSELLADLCDFKEKIDQSSAILKVALDEVNDSTEETNIYDMSHFSTVTGLENIKFLEEGIFSHDVQPPCDNTLHSKNIDLSEGIKPKQEKDTCENRENVIFSESIEFGSNDDNGALENITFCDNSPENQPCMKDTLKIYSEEKVLETNANVTQDRKCLSIPDTEVDKSKERNGSEYGCKENDSPILQSATYTVATPKSFYDPWKEIFNEAVALVDNIPSNQNMNEKYIEDRANNSNYSFDSDLHYSENSTNKESFEGKINKNHFIITETLENVKSPEKGELYLGNVEESIFCEPEKTHSNDICEEILEKVECQKIFEEAKCYRASDSVVDNSNYSFDSDLHYSENSTNKESFEGKINKNHFIITETLENVKSPEKGELYLGNVEESIFCEPEKTDSNNICEEILEEADCQKILEEAKCYRASDSAVDDINEGISYDDGFKEKNDGSISMTEIYNEETNSNNVCKEILENDEYYKSLEKAECHRVLSSEVDDINEKISSNDDSKEKTDSYRSQAELYNECDPLETCPNDVREEILEKAECYKTLASVMDDIQDSSLNSSISQSEIYNENESDNLERQLNKVCEEILEEAGCYTTLSSDVVDITERISCENDCKVTDDSSISQTEIYNERNPVESYSNDICEEILGEAQCCRSLASEVDDIKDSPCSQSEIYNESDPVAHSNDAFEENLERVECYNILVSKVNDIKEMLSCDYDCKDIQQTEIYNDCEIVETHSNDACEEILEKAECSKIFIGEENEGFISQIEILKKSDPVETHSSDACEDNLKKVDHSEILINEVDTSKESLSYVGCCNDSPISQTELYNECELVETHSNDACEHNFTKVERSGILISHSGVDDIKESISCDYHCNDSLTSQTEIYNECEHLETELNDVCEEILEEAECSNILVGEVDIIENNVSSKEKNDSSISETEMYKVSDPHLNNASEELLEKANNVKEDQNHDSNMMIGDESALGHDENVNKLSSTVSCDITNVDFDITEHKKGLMLQDMNKKEMKICLLKLDIDHMSAIKSDVCVNSKEKLSAQKMDLSETMDKPIDTFLCTICRPEFGTNMDLTEHKNSVCSCNPKTGKQVGGRARFLNKWHVSQLEKEGALCSCGKRFPNINILTDHMNVDHTDKKYLKCGYCFREFNRKVAFRNHLKAHIKKNC